MTSRVDPLVHFDTPFEEEIVVGQGQYQVLKGTLHWAGHTIQSLDFNQGKSRQYDLELFASAKADSIEFFLRVLWLPDDIGHQHELSIKLSDRADQQAELALGKVRLIAHNKPVVPTHTGFQDEPLIAICMATYAPEIERFTTQLESILCQSYQNWLLIVCDDAAPDYDMAPIKALCAADPRRIRLICHDENLGFYHNFERALNYVPDNAELIALSDQDDSWYPDKLEKLARALNHKKAQLVYSDMRIVHESGEVIAETYWLGRKNEFVDFDTVFLANTVTGAASLFRREMLDSLLPFPARVGDAFHDHWMACCALTRGTIAYIDEPLYDYMQYGDSVIGHCDFVRWTPMQRFKSVLGILRRFLQPRQAKQWLGQKLGGGMAIYRGECLRLKLIADTLKRRVPEKANMSTLNLMNGGMLSTLKLLKVHLKILVSGRTTDDAEFRLAMGFIARAYQKKRQK